MRKIGFLGPEGTFTQQAALTYAKDNPGELVSFSSIPELLAAVQKNQVDFGVIPIENSLEGAVNTSLDILAWEVDLLIQAEITLPISHNLLINPGANWQSITKIYTHPQASAQCRKFLENELPKAEVHFTYSTAEGAKLVKEKGSHCGAIAPLQSAVIFQLDAARKNIQDTDNNCTRFVLVGTSETKPTGRDKTSIVFSTEHKPGSLYRVLDIFSLWDINMSKIESRPAREKLGTYIFFVDIEGHSADSDMADALTMIRRKTTFYKFLGSYPRAGLT